MVEDPGFLGHGKLQHVRDELQEFFKYGVNDSRVIIFTELRESALEIVKCIDSMNDDNIIPHIFIGQARGKEGFDEVSYTRKHQPKGRKKIDRLKRLEEEKEMEERKRKKKEQDALQRSSSRTGSSEDAQINGMNQKQQKEVIKQFKNGIYNVLVCTSIGEEGLDIGEVDLIICYDTTSSPIKNIQRMGRTGRKRDGKIVLLFSSNEGSKFEKAMENYSNLQKLISQHHVEYKKSDRILPDNIIPKCEKKFIEINEEDQEVNSMNDSDDLIRYATQCMMGKKPKHKKVREKNKTIKQKKKTEKQFFMPDDVETGIVSASTLVNKVQPLETDDLAIDPVVERPIKKRKFSVLDKLENDSLSSGTESDKDDLLLVGAPRSLSIGTLIHSGPNEISDDIMTPIVAPPNNVKDKGVISKPGVLLNEIDGTSTILLDSRQSELSVRKIPNEVNKNIHKMPITMKNDMESSSDNIELRTDKRTSSFVRNIEVKNKTVSTDVLSEKYNILTQEEEVHFGKNYFPSVFTISAAPKFSSHSKSSYTPHTKFTQGMITLFKDVDNQNMKQKIEMNKIFCVARGLQNGVFSADNTIAPSFVVANDEIS